MSAEEIEYEVEAMLEGEPLTLHFHARCYDTWRLSREAHAPVGAPPPAK